MAMTTSRNNTHSDSDSTIHQSGQSQKGKAHPVIRVIAIALFLGTCTKAPSALPSGSWQFALYLNGNRVGSASITQSNESGRYVTITEMTMKAGEVTSISKQIITETENFTPVKYETYNKIIKGSMVQNIDTVAEFSGRKVKLIAGTSIQEIELEKDFKLEGNYFLSKLIEAGFKKDMKVEAYIYEPAIDPETPILMKVYALGRENIKIGEETHLAFHIIEYIEKFKSFDMYLDEKGMLLKAELTMLNMNIQLVRE